LAVEVTGLLRRGQQEYLLEDARAAAARGQVLVGTARQCYQAFLRGDSDNLDVRSEYAALLAREVASNGGRAAGAEEAVSENRMVVRAYLDRNRPAEAFQCYREAERNGIRLNPPPGERLRLARAAEDQGDLVSAEKLLRSVIREYPNSPEDEISRLRLGQLILGPRPAEAAEVLRGLLERYPQSQWKALAAQLRQNGLAQAKAQNQSSGEVNPA
jgi:pentatricopeptide repeat protein